LIIILCAITLLTFRTHLCFLFCVAIDLHFHIFAFFYTFLKVEEIINYEEIIISPINHQSNDF